MQLLLITREMEISLRTVQAEKENSIVYGAKSQGLNKFLINFSSQETCLECVLCSTVISNIICRFKLDRKVNYLSIYDISKRGRRKMATESMKIKRKMERKSGLKVAFQIIITVLHHLHSRYC